MAENKKSKRKFIIDADPGTDDAVAMLIAFDKKAKVDVLAITCVNGNAKVDQAIHNTLITLKQADVKVPVYRGCSTQLNTLRAGSDNFFSEDAFGGIADKYPTMDGCYEKGPHGVLKLIELVNKYPGEITLVALGPLTNIALAYRLDEKFSSNLQRLVIMGGNTEGVGNVSMAAEFNFFIDPEAAAIVLEESKCDTQVIGWEVSGIRSAFSWEWYLKWVASATTPKGKFVASAVDQVANILHKIDPNRGFALADPVAMMVALAPKIVTKSTHQKATVELAGRNTRGMLVAEYAKGLFPRQDVKPVELVLEINMKKYEKVLQELVV